MPLTAMWTHGNAVVPETPELLEKITRFGFGTHVLTKGGTSHWFHVPMPTPVFLSGNRPTLRRIIILTKSDDVSTCIRRVHIYDGNDRVQDHDVLICGDKLNFNPDSVVETGSPTIFKGLGISMFLDAATTTEPLSFFFGAFGADWESL